MTETTRLEIEKDKSCKPLVKWAKKVVQYGIHPDAVGHEQTAGEAIAMLACALLEDLEGETDE